MTRDEQKRATTWLLVSALTVVSGACGSDMMRSWLDNATPRERYEQALLDAGLDQTALGRDWLAAGAAALERAVEVSAPYREESYLDEREAAAWGYRVTARRGQWLRVTLERATGGAYRVFLDVFRMPRDSGGRPRQVASADSLAHSLEYYVSRDADYVVRLQPELLRGGRYVVTIALGPSLAFPVDGHDTTAIASRFGDARDGGRRRHEGLDIFAPRGTPVLAAADGTIRSTRPNNLGGNVVWLRDALGRSLYYAHLDRHVVYRGQRVRVGDTLGYVGNSGNARTTPPHLHFGVYRRGAFDPYPALYRSATTPAGFTGNPGLIGTLARARRDGVRVRARPSSRSAIVAELPLHTSMSVEGGSGDWYRVVLPDGAAGFVAASLTEPLDGPVRRERVASGAPLLAGPGDGAAAIDSVAAGSEVGVLGVFREYLYVRGPSGRGGWVAVN
jgi:murein DD-endopeptidase MepM/ murein hydrolase activator NlpD